jgi:type II secretory pathway component PulF
MGSLLQTGCGLKNCWNIAGKSKKEEEEQKIQEQIMKQLKKMRPLKTKEDKKKIFSLRL